MTKNKKKLFTKKVYGVLCFISGITIIVVSVVIYTNFRSELRALINHGHETTAIVSSIRGKGSDAPADIYVRYLVDSVAYDTRLEIGERGRYVGEEVVILYNPDNPGRITARDRHLVPLDNPERFNLIFFFGIFLGIFLGACGYIIARYGE